MSNHYNPSNETIQSVLSYRRGAKAPLPEETALSVARAVSMHPLMVVSVFKALEAKGLGRYIVGRKGAVTRFQWKDEAIKRVPSKALPIIPPAPASQIQLRAKALPRRQRLAIPIRGGRAMVTFGGPPNLSSEDLQEIGQLFLAMGAEMREDPAILEAVANG